MLRNNLIKVYNFNTVKTVFTVLILGIFVEILLTVVKTVAVITPEPCIHIIIFIPHDLLPSRHKHCMHGNLQELTHQFQMPLTGCLLSI